MICTLIMRQNDPLEAPGRSVEGAVLFSRENTFSPYHELWSLGPLQIFGWIMSNARSADVRERMRSPTRLANCRPRSSFTYMAVVPCRNAGTTHVYRNDSATPRSRPAGGRALRLTDACPVCAHHVQATLQLSIYEAQSASCLRAPSTSRESANLQR